MYPDSWYINQAYFFHEISITIPCHGYHRLGLGKYFLEFFFNKDGLFFIIFTTFVIVVIVMRRLMFKKRKYLWRTSTKTYLFFASPDWDNWCGLQWLWILTQCPNGWYWMMLLLLKQEKCRISIFCSNTFAILQEKMK